MSVIKTWATKGYISHKSNISPQIQKITYQIATSKGVADTVLRLAKETYEYLEKMVLLAIHLGLGPVFSATIL
jgi:hypothetical protein